VRHAFSGSSGRHTANFLSFAIVRVEVRGSSCVRVELGNSSKIPRVSIPRQCRGNVFRNSSTLSRNWLRHVVQIVGPSQPEMAKPDWYQRVSIDHFHWTIAGPTNWLVWAWAKKIFSTLSKNCEKHFLEIVEELTRTPDLYSNASVFPRLEPFKLDNLRSSNFLNPDFTETEKPGRKYWLAKDNIDLAYVSYYRHWFLLCLHLSSRRYIWARCMVHYVMCHIDRPSVRRSERCCFSYQPILS